MWQERRAKLLREEIELFLAPLSNADGLHDLVKETLTRTKRGLIATNKYDYPWHLLPLIVCEAISGHYENALPAAAARQFFLAAADVLDDIEDVDSFDSLSVKYGPAIAINVATTLLILAETAISRLKEKGADDHLTIRVMTAFNSFYTTACAGQHLDLSFNSETTISEETYLKIIEMKTASQVECACQVGALLANANQEFVDKFTEFGYGLGMASQIANDIQGIIRKNDIIGRKITLPVIYAFAQTNNEDHRQLELAFGKNHECVPDPKKIMDLLLHVGAIHYATIKMEFYRQCALEVLSSAEAAGARVERLKLFLE